MLDFYFFFCGRASVSLYSVLDLIPSHLVPDMMTICIFIFYIYIFLCIFLLA